MFVKWQNCNFGNFLGNFFMLDIYERLLNRAILLRCWTFCTPREYSLLKHCFDAVNYTRHAFVYCTYGVSCSMTRPWRGNSAPYLWRIIINSRTWRLTEHMAMNQYSCHAMTQLLWPTAAYSSIRSSRDEHCCLSRAGRVVRPYRRARALLGDPK